MLAVLVAITVSIRVIFELLAPVWPYLLAAVVVFALVGLHGWYRDRW
jgi:uncharacterized membrane protein